MARPLIYDEAYLEKPWTVSQGNLQRVTEPSLFLLLVQPDKKSWEESTSLKGSKFLKIFANKSMRKVRSESKVESKPTAVHTA